MEDRDACPVCFENFTLPKLLPCSHTFCLQCLKDYCSQVAIQDKNKPKEELTAEQSPSPSKPKGEIICPLCRNVCMIPEKGFEDLLTNYFIQTSQPPITCEICEEEIKISKYCTACFRSLCKSCFLTHTHNDKNYRGDAVKSISPRLPIHLLFLTGLRTEYICELVKTFNLDVPADERGRRHIYSVFTAKNGGAYVLPATVPFILKFESNGKLLGKIRTPEACLFITELGNGDILGIFRQSHLILRYSFGGWSHFTSTYDYFPMSITEMSDSRILICGTNGLSSGEESDATILGIVKFYSVEGKYLSNFEKTENMFLRPYLAVANKNSKTFAIGDQKRHSVTIFRESGEELTSYNGGSTIFNLPLPLFQVETAVNFHPIEMCCSPRGNFIISSEDGTLHVLDPYGKLRGVAVANCKDGFGRMTDVAVDTTGNIWCSNSDSGSIKIFRLVQYKNRLNQTDFPLTE